MSRIQDIIDVCDEIVSSYHQHSDTDRGSHDFECLYCNGKGYGEEPIEHDLDCSVLKAKDILKGYGMTTKKEKVKALFDAIKRYDAELEGVPYTDDDEIVMEEQSCGDMVKHEDFSELLEAVIGVMEND